MNAFLNFLAAHSDSIGAAGAVVASVIWHAIRGDKRDSWRVQLKTLAQQIVHFELGDPTRPGATEKLRLLVERAARPLLAAVGAKGALADALIAEAVQIAQTELGRMLTQAAQQRAAMAAIEAGTARVALDASRVLDAFSRGPLVSPPSEGLVQLEIVKSDAEVGR